MAEVQLTRFALTSSGSMPNPVRGNRFSWIQAEEVSATSARSDLYCASDVDLTHA